MQLSVFHWVPLLFKWSPYTPFKGLRKASPPYTLLLPSGTSAVQTRAGCEHRGRTERPRCSGPQPHAFHSDMKARCLPSSKATTRKKKHGGKRREGKKIPKYARLLNMDVLLAESKAVCACLATRSISHVFSWARGGRRQTTKRHVLIINYKMYKDLKYTRFDKLSSISCYNVCSMAQDDIGCVADCFWNIDGVGTWHRELWEGSTEGQHKSTSWFLKAFLQCMICITLYSDADNLPALH